MKRQVSTGYVFTPASAKLDLSAVPGLTAGGLLAVLNVSTGGIVYAVGSPGLGASFAGLVLTLAAPLAGMASGDALAVLFDDGALGAKDSSIQGLAATFGLPTDAAATSDAGAFAVVALLKRALGYLSALAGTLKTQDANGAAFSGSAVMTPGGAAVPAGRSIEFLCTAAGSITFNWPGGGTHTVSVAAAPNTQTLPYSTIGIATSGTTATCTYANLY